jgi:CheY-like chemotaxis protein
MLEPVWRFIASDPAGQAIDRCGHDHLRDVMMRVCSIIGAADLQDARDLILQHLRRVGTPITFAEAGVPAREAAERIAQNIDAVRMGNHLGGILPDDAARILESLC